MVYLSISKICFPVNDHILDILDQNAGYLPHSAYKKGHTDRYFEAQDFQAISRAGELAFLDS